MPVDENKLNEAFNLVDEAESLATSGELAKSIFKFQQALDLFDKCGLSIKKKQNVLDMVSSRQAEVAKLQQYLKAHPEMRDELLGSTTDTGDVGMGSPPITMSYVPMSQSSPNQNYTSPGTPPPNIELLGIHALDEANLLVKQGQYPAAIGKFYEAAELLIQAGWDETSLMNIQNEVQRISLLIQQAQSQTQSQTQFSSSYGSTPQENIQPTFLQTQQTGYQQNNQSSIDQKNTPGEYTPTFAQTQQMGNQSPQQPMQPFTSSGASEYVPTFAQTGQNDFARTNAKTSVQSPVPEAVYQPTFLQTQQGSSPPPSASPSPSPSQQYPPKPHQNESYSPTFAQTQQAGYQPRMGGNNSGLNSQSAYIPTFAQTQQADQITHVQSGQKGSQDAYVPTFAQTQQADQIISHQATPQSSNEPYVPSFAKSGQSDIVPQMNSTPSSTQSGQYSPSFQTANVHSDNIFDPEEFQKMIQNVQQGKPAEEGPSFAKISQQDVVSHSQSSTPSDVNLDLSTPAFLKAGQNDIITANPVRLEMNAAPSFMAAGQSDFVPNQPVISKIISAEPSFMNIERKSLLEQKAQTLLDEFQQQRDLLEGMRLEAFDLINNAIQLEQDGKNTLAIEQLEDAIDMFNSMPGWKLLSLMIYARISVLSEKIESNQGELQNSEMLSKIKSDLSSLMEKDPTLKIQIQLQKTVEQGLKAEEMFADKILQEEQLQDKIFQLLDQGQLLTTNEAYDNAIAVYNKAIIFLNSLGWLAQTNQAQELISEISKLRSSSETHLTEDLQDSELVGLSNDEIRSALQQRFEIRRNKIKSIEDSQIKQEAAQQESYQLIDQAEAAINQNQFELALSNYEKAADILINANWEESLPKINERIIQIRKLQDDYYLSKQKSYQQEIMILERQSQHSQQLSSQTQLNTASQKEIEGMFKEAEMYQNDALFDDARQVYSKAKILIEQSNWDEQLSYLEFLIKQLDRRELEHQQFLEAQQRQQVQAQQTQKDFEHFLNEQAKLIKSQQEARKNRLESFQQQKEQQQQSQEEAFKLLDDAEKLVARNQFSDAIRAYQDADILFKKMGWKIDINQQINSVKQSQMQYESQLSEVQLEQKRKEEAMQKAQIAAENKKKQELNQLLDIKSMIKNAAQQKAVEKDDVQRRVEEREKMKAEMMSWSRKQTYTSPLKSLRNELLGLTNSTSPETASKSKEESQREKEMKEMEEFRKMIRAASKQENKD